MIGEAWNARIDVCGRWRFWVDVTRMWRMIRDCGEIAISRTAPDAAPECFSSRTRLIPVSGGASYPAPPTPNYARTHLLPYPIAIAIIDPSITFAPPSAHVRVQHRARRDPHAPENFPSRSPTSLSAFCG